MSKSCVGCKFLYSHSYGYSDYTEMGTHICCWKEKNPKLPEDRPYDWNEHPDQDNWPLTNQSRCDEYVFRDPQYMPWFSVEEEVDEKEFA